MASPARQFASVGSLTSKRVVYLPWSTFPANLKISMIPARRNGRRGKPLMVIVTRGRGRIDTLCQMLCRFHAQITQQQRHRLRASQTTGIAKCPQRNSSRTIKQRPGNDQALYAPARQRVKICSLCSPACTSRPRCVNAFSFQRQRAENHSYKAAICWGAPGKQSAGGDPFLQQRQMLRDLRQCQMTGIQHRRQFFHQCQTQTKRRI